MTSSIHSLHFKLYKKLKNAVADLEEQKSPSLINYQKEFEIFCDGEFKKSSTKELLTAIKSSKIIYMGDFHTFDQSSKNMERVLKYILDNNQKPVLAMEMIHFKHQNYVEAYLAGNITELEFLESIEYHHSWRFPWSHYKYFFDMAKKNKLKIIGLNSEGPLGSRDSFASAVLAGLVKKQAKEKILVLFGELHLLPNKIPDLVREQFPHLPIKDVIIQQNIDQIYWKSPHAKIVKFNPRVFSIQASPPWTKYDSCLYWYDHLADDPEFDLHEYVREVSLKKLSEYSIDTFAGICENTRQSFGFAQEDLNLSSNFTLVDSSKIEWLMSKLEQKYPKTIVKMYKEFILENKLMRFPGTSYLYAPSYSLNRLAYLSGMHLFGILFSRYMGDENKIYLRPAEEKYIYYFQQSLWGHLGSKIYNPFRKTDLYLDLQEKVRRKDKHYREIDLGLKIFKKPEKINEFLSSLDDAKLFISAQKLGHFIGDCLFRVLNDTKDFNQFASLAWNFTLTKMDIIVIKDIIEQDLDYKKERKRLF